MTTWPREQTRLVSFLSPWQNVRGSKFFKREFVLTCKFSVLSQSSPLFRGYDGAVRQGRMKMAEKALQQTDSGSGEGPTIAFQVPLLITNFLPLGLLKVYHVPIAPPHVPSVHHMDFWEHSFRLKPKQKLLKQNASVGQTQEQNSIVATKPWSFLSFYTWWELNWPLSNWLAPTTVTELTFWRQSCSEFSLSVARSSPFSLWIIS